MSIKDLVKAIDQSIKDATSGDPLFSPVKCYDRAVNLIHGASLVGGLTSSEFVYWTNHVQEARRRHNHLAEPVQEAKAEAEEGHYQ